MMPVEVNEIPKFECCRHITITKAGREVELTVDWQPTWRSNQRGDLRYKSRAWLNLTVASQGKA